METLCTGKHPNPLLNQPSIIILSKSSLILEFPASRRTFPGRPIDESCRRPSVLLTRAGNFISMSKNKPLSGIKAPDKRQRYHGSLIPLSGMNSDFHDDGAYTFFGLLEFCNSRINAFKSHIFFLSMINIIFNTTAIKSWRVLDVAVAMAYALITSFGKNNKSISAACALLRGLNQIYPLTSHERKHLRLLIACRLATSVTLGNYSYKLNPTNEYLLLHSKPAWDALYLIWGKDGSGAGGTTAHAVEDAFRIACDNINSTDSSIPDCADISFPDPSVVDPLASARTANKQEAPSNGNSSEPNTITFVTGNKKKAEEVRRILSSGAADFPFTITNHKIDLPELQGDDPVVIAKEKCTLAVNEVKGAVVTEDTSLCFSALNGLPGPYIKWFLDKNGLDGLNDIIAFSDDKTGYAQTVVAFCPGPGKDVITFDGRTQGKIVRPRGKLDFGWDPIFEPDEGDGLTYAEMDGEQKDSISHRKRAFVKLRDYMKQHKDNIASSINSL